MDIYIYILNAHVGYFMQFRVPYYQSLFPSVVFVDRLAFCQMRGKTVCSRRQFLFDAGNRFVEGQLLP